MVKKEKDFECQHIKKKQDKSIFIYHLINRDLCLCERCEAKLRKQIFEQDKIEKEAPKFIELPKEIRKDILMPRDFGRGSFKSLTPEDIKRGGKD
jgi:hypothetical protein